LCSTSPEILRSRAEGESQRLIHELEVHRVELELQNEELRRARDEAEGAFEKYSDLYDFAPIGYFTLDHDGKILAANLTGASLLGIERSRLIGRRFDNFITPDGSTTFIPFLGKVFSSRVKESGEVTLKRGGKRPLHVQIEAMAGNAGEECRIAVIDISARWETEEKLRESESRYASLFHNRHIAMLLIDPKTGNIISANPAACSFYGYSSKQFASLKISDINSLPQQDISNKMDQALNNKNSHFHFRHRLANGEMRDVEVYSGPIEIGERRLLYTMIHDISERKRMEEKLCRSERQLALAQGIAHIGSWEWDSISDEITGSDEFNRIFGQPLSTYDSFLELVHPDDRETVNSAVRDTLAHQAPYNVHYRIIRPDGTRRTIHAQGAAVTDDAGKTVAIIGTCQDVTERRELEERLEIQNAELVTRSEELRATNRNLEAFTAAVSHDLRSYLNNIYGFSQVLQLDACAEQLDEGCRSHIMNIKKGCEGMTQLIDTLLTFFRMAKTEINMTRVSLTNMVSGIATELNGTTPERKCAFQIMEGVTAWGDPALLRIVMSNLLGNAWKYSAFKEETVIEFGVAGDERKSVYFVRDNGVGFDMAKAGSLFTPFHRLHNRERFTGHGIGLATVERIISRHGGKIWAESEPDRGATFYFTLQDT
jgi:PAS domain S-box-containing protein